MLGSSWCATPDVLPLLHLFYVPLGCVFPSVSSVLYRLSSGRPRAAPHPESGLRLVSCEQPLLSVATGKDKEVTLQTLELLTSLVPQ